MSSQREKFQVRGARLSRDLLTSADPDRFALSRAADSMVGCQQILSAPIPEERNVAVGAVELVEMADLVVELSGVEPPTS